MDMSVFSKELESAGFSTPEIKGNRFNKKDDLVLPFIASSPELYQIDRKIINDANYIYSTKRPLTEEEFVDCVKILPQHDVVSQKIYKWVLNHMNSIQVVNRGGMHKKAGSFNAAKDFSDRYDADTEYGLVALGFYIEYDPVGMVLKLALHTGYKINRMLGDKVDVWDWHKPDCTVEILDTLLGASEFMPVDLAKDELKVYINYFRTNDLEECVSSYGANILDDKCIMEGLVKSGWLKHNTVINPNVWYFVLNGKFGLFLRRDLSKSPKPVRG